MQNAAVHQTPQLLLSQSTEVGYPDLLEPVNTLTSSRDFPSTY